MKFISVLVLLVSSAIADPATVFEYAVGPPVAVPTPSLEERKVLDSLTRNPPTLPPGTQFTPQGVPIVRSSYANRDRSVNPHYDGQVGLDHYSDFVNDPWKNTENLAQILSSRNRPELRSGYESNRNDDVWRPTRRQGRRQYEQNWNQNQLETRSQVQQTPRHYLEQSAAHTGLKPYSYTSPNYNQNANHGYSDNWEVESRGENHITYTKARNNPSWQVETEDEYAPLRQFGSGDRKVSARVVDTRPRVEETRRNLNTNRRQNWQTDDRRRWQNQRQPELRSLDPAPVHGYLHREGDWVKTSESDTRVTWKRVGTFDHHRPTTSPWAEESVTTRSYPEYRNMRPAGHRRYDSWQSRQWQSTPAPIRYHPIAMEREMAEKARREGNQNVMILA